MTNFEKKLTDYAAEIYYLVKEYRNSARQSPVSEYEFVDYCPELTHELYGELFTVFKTKLNGKDMYICYGSEDSLQIMCLNTLSKRL